VKKHNQGEQHHRAKLTTLEVTEIRRLYKERDYTYNVLSVLFGISIRHVREIISGKKWGHLN